MLVQLVWHVSLLCADKTAVKSGNLDLRKNLDIMKQIRLTKFIFRIKKSRFKKKFRNSADQIYFRIKISRFKEQNCPDLRLHCTSYEKSSAPKTRPLSVNVIKTFFFFQNDEVEMSQLKPFLCTHFSNPPSSLELRNEKMKMKEKEEQDNDQNSTKVVTVVSLW